MKHQEPTFLSCFAVSSSQGPLAVISVSVHIILASAIARDVLWPPASLQPFSSGVQCELELGHAWVQFHIPARENPVGPPGVRCPCWGQSAAGGAGPGHMDSGLPRPYTTQVLKDEPVGTDGQTKSCAPFQNTPLPLAFFSCQPGPLCPLPRATPSGGHPLSLCLAPFTFTFPNLWSKVSLPANVF